MPHGVTVLLRVPPADSGRRCRGFRVNELVKVRRLERRGPSRGAPLVLGAADAALAADGRGPPDAARRSSGARAQSDAAAADSSEPCRGGLGGGGGGGGAPLRAASPRFGSFGGDGISSGFSLGVFAQRREREGGKREVRAGLVCVCVCVCGLCVWVGAKNAREKEGEDREKRAVATTRRAKNSESCRKKPFFFLGLPLSTLSLLKAFRFALLPFFSSSLLSPLAFFFRNTLTLELFSFFFASSTPPTNSNSKKGFLPLAPLLPPLQPPLSRSRRSVRRAALSTPEEAVSGSERSSRAASSKKDSCLREEALSAIRRRRKNQATAKPSERESSAEETSTSTPETVSSPHQLS